MAGGTAGLRMRSGTDASSGHRHICWSYEDDDAFSQGVEAFVRTGLNEGQRVVARISADRVEDAERHLSLRLPEARLAVRDGSLLVQAAREAYAPAGTFDPDDALAELRDLAARAIADGHAALRVLTEVSDLKDQPTFLAHWPTFEIRADLLRASGGVVALCAYDARRCRGSTMQLLRSLHPASRGSFPEDASFRIHATSTGGLMLRGEVDLFNAEAVAALGPIAAGDVCEPVLDVSDLRFVDVSGMRALADTLEAMSSRFPQVRIRGASHAFARLWDLMLFDRRIPALLD